MNSALIETKSNYMIWYDYAVIKLNHLFESMDHIAGASMQQAPHPLPEQINHMTLSPTSTPPIASRFGTMLINTVQEEGTQGVSSIQGASGDLVDADTGEDGNGETWDEAQAEFLERFESMPEESLQAQARSGAAWDAQPEFLERFESMPE
jgi:hypothetical protein